MSDALQIRPQPCVVDSPPSATLTSSGQPASNTPSDTLVLPKFKKNQRKIDHAAHDGCCDRTPPGEPSSTEPSALAENDIGVKGFACFNIGTRDYMEDRHKIRYGRKDGLFDAFFGVFDGHGGEEASHFTGGHLADFIEDELETAYREKTGQSAPTADGDEQKTETPISISSTDLAALGLDYKSAIYLAFDRLESEVLRQSRRIGCRDGTTVTSVLVTHDSILCANVGDSRTVLCRENNAVALSADHKPSNSSERARIREAGGEVRAVMLDRAAFCCFKAKKVPHGAERLWPGGFSVSRAVGDIDYKDLRRKKATVVNVLIHRPDITVTSKHPRDQFIICGSDGLWDVLTNQQAVEFVLKELKKKKATEPVKDIAQKLADHAYSLGSEDNITALIMFFPNNRLPFKT